MAKASQEEFRIVGASMPSFRGRDEILCPSCFLAIVVDEAVVLELTLGLHPQHQSLEQCLARGGGEELRAGLRGAGCALLQGQGQRKLWFDFSSFTNEALMNVLGSSMPVLFGVLFDPSYL